MNELDKEYSSHLVEYASMNGFTSEDEPAAIRTRLHSIVANTVCELTGTGTVYPDAIQKLVKRVVERELDFVRSVS